MSDDRMADIPFNIERKMFRSREIRRALAYSNHEPYCFVCDRHFGSHAALAQHRSANHTGNPADD